MLSQQIIIEVKGVLQYNILTELGIQSMQPDEQCKDIKMNAMCIQ